ncbi:uncharacterized protein A4U43_C10F13710 [Asparagus officinalis]|uniref:non-specific serine/threonine protein kinase n=1 Tax=Asparagus officinalis TaxID=4686 RepID=A0A5P1E768_ASPOF|nr:uncharacterized protein A4U43_C10F13710 [Asparagus officinalis]
MGGCYSSQSSNLSDESKSRRCLPSISSSDHVDNLDDIECIDLVAAAAKPYSTSILRNPSSGEEFLCRGEFGVTRRCTDIETGEKFACKTISKLRLKNCVDAADVRREVEIMRHFPNHPNIVQLRDAYEDEEAVHLVMELCQGGELFDRIVARGHYTERAAAGVAKTIIEIVQLCHKHGVIHRDLKPENFLFANESETAPLKAIDFGLSAFFEPEVLKRNYGPEADVWSAGVILYILLCGVPPFWAETDEGIAQAIIQSVIDFDREPWPKVSENAKDLVRHMLDPNPSSRLTAQEVLEHPWMQNASTAPDIPLGDTVRCRLQQFSVMNKFKKKALRVVAGQLPMEEVACIKQVFDLMDTDKNGNLTLEELKEGLQYIGSTVDEPDAQMLLEAADVDGNGTIDRDEFVTVSVHLKKISSKEHLSEAFRYFDKDGSGYIEIDELREALGEGDLCPNEQVIEEIISDIDVDKDGRISYPEFQMMMEAGMDWRNTSRQHSRAAYNTLSQRMFRIESFDES